MDWIYDMRERHIRRALVFGLFFVFLWFNSGHTINGIYHVVLSARASFLDTVDGELAAAIGLSTLSFGSSICALILVFTIWFGFDRVLKWYDYDSYFIDSPADMLRKENTKLLELLRSSNEQLTFLNTTIKRVTEKNAALSKHQDRVVELSIELEKLSRKAAVGPVVISAPNESDAPDLFLRPKPAPKSNGRRPPRPRNPSPKF